MAGARGAEAGANDWLRRARRYLRIAKAMIDAGFPDAAAFNSHQAMEFALKALHIRRTGRYPRTHDLTRLASLVSAPTRYTKLAALVTPAYIAARYPDVGGPRITRRRAETYLDAARRVLRWVVRQMA